MLCMLYIKILKLIQDDSSSMLTPILSFNTIILHAQKAKVPTYNDL